MTDKKRKKRGRFLCVKDGRASYRVSEPNRARASCRAMTDLELAHVLRGNQNARFSCFLLAVHLCARDSFLCAEGPPRCAHEGTVPQRQYVMRTERGAKKAETGGMSSWGRC